MTEPSLKFTTASLFGNMPNSRTEYILGRNFRFEHRDCRGLSDPDQPDQQRFEFRPLRAFIHNRDIQRSFRLDLDSHVYTALRVNEHGSPVWSKPPRMRAQKKSGRTVQINTETIDTGERKQIFSYTARHVITRTITQTWEAGKELPSKEAETDCWYIDPPAAWLRLHPPSPSGYRYFLTSNGHQMKSSL